MQTLWFYALLIGLTVGCSGKAATDSSTATTKGPGAEGPLQYSPVVQWEASEFEGFPVRSYVPPNAKGIVVMFHGTNTDVSYVSVIESVAFLNELIVEGIGFVATNSEDRVAKQWSDADNARVGRLYEHMIDTTDLKASGALFTAGFSNGGNMTGVFAGYAQEQGWPIAATAPHMASCWSCRDLDIPTAWVMARMDEEADLNAAQDAFEDMKDRGVPAKLWIAEEQDIDEASFTKNPEMDAERAKQVYDDLVAKELINAAGKRIVPDDEAGNWPQWYASNGDCFAPGSRAEELKVFWAQHRMNAYYARDVRDFFLARMP